MKNELAANYKKVARREYGNPDCAFWASVSANVADQGAGHRLSTNILSFAIAVRQ